MHKKFAQVSACIFAAAMMMSVAATNVTDDIDTVVTATTPFAGITYTMSSAINADTTIAYTETIMTAAPETTSTEVLAVATVNDSVNVRAEASAEAASVGKLYANNVCVVSEEENGFYKIKSANVEGYVSSEYISTDESLVAAAGTVKATVTTNALRVRKEASEDAGVKTLVSENSTYTVLETTEDGWIKIKTSSGEGYISADYATVETVYSYGATNEEIQKLEEAAKAAAAKKAAAAASPSNKYASNPATSYKAASGHDGASVYSFASQFVGCPYRASGTSLTNGADCSGFVMAVYQQYGVGLPHNSTAMRSVGTAVSYENMRVGDIVCYSGHVGIYAGNGQMLSALNRRSGIAYIDVNYKPIITIRRIFN